jgi:hypothetical protein
VILNSLLNLAPPFELIASTGGGGSLTQDDIDAIVAAVVAALRSSVPIYVISPVQPRRLDLFHGDAYLAAQGAGRTLSFVKQATELVWPDTLSEAHFYARPTAPTLDAYPNAAGLTDIACSVVVATGDDQEVQLDLTATDCATLQQGTTTAVNYHWWIVANKGTYPATIRTGTMIVRPQAA